MAQLDICKKQMVKYSKQIISQSFSKGILLHSKPFTLCIMQSLSMASTGTMNDPRSLLLLMFGAPAAALEPVQERPIPPRAGQNRSWEVGP